MTDTLKRKMPTTKQKAPGKIGCVRRLCRSVCYTVHSSFVAIESVVLALLIVRHSPSTFNTQISLPFCNMRVSVRRTHTFKRCLPCAAEWVSMCVCGVVPFVSTIRIVFAIQQREGYKLCLS